MENCDIFMIHFLNCCCLKVELQAKVAAIEAENKSIREEFNVQRAKLKDLFLQKEGNNFRF